MTLRRTSARRCLRRNMNRVVITGIGCCYPFRMGRRAASARAFAGGCPAFAPRSPAGVFRLPVSDLGMMRRIPFFSAWRHRRYLNRGAALAVLSGLRAAASAGFDHMPSTQTLPDGASGPMLDFDRENGLPPADSEALDALWLLRWLPNTGNTALARFLDIHGEGLVLGTACVSRAAGHRGGLPARAVRPFGNRPLLVRGFPPFPRRNAWVCQAHALSRNPVPSEASRPFDEARDGFVPGEGGDAPSMLESAESARARGGGVCRILRLWGFSGRRGAHRARDRSALPGAGGTGGACRCGP